MRGLSKVVIIVGVVWAIIAFSFDTSVPTDIGRVNNLGLMAERQNYIIFSGITILIGVILLGFSTKTIQSSANSDKFTLNINCPFCAEEIKSEAKICKHCGKDIPISAVDLSPILKSTIVSKKDIENGGHVRCDSCGADNKASNKICFRCDAPIVVT